jgi:hypothetical protein
MRMFTSPSTAFSILAAMYCLSGCGAVPDEASEAADLDSVQAKLELEPTNYPDAIRIDAASTTQRCFDAIKRCQKKCDDACGARGLACASITTSSTLGGCACLEWRCSNAPKVDLFEPAIFQTP